MPNSKMNIQKQSSELYVDICVSLGDTHINVTPIDHLVRHREIKIKTHLTCNL